MQIMITVAQLVPAIAAATGLEEETVRQHARFVREAGFLPATVGKKLAYAEPRHAAILLAAILVDHRVVKAGDAAAIACSMRAIGYELTGKPGPAPPPEALFGLAPDHSFVDALEALIREAMVGDIRAPSGVPCNHYDVGVTGPWLVGSIVLWDGPHWLKIGYSTEAPPDPPNLTDEAARAWAAAMTARYGRGDLQTERRVTLHTIGALGEALAGIGDSGTPPENAAA
jgi:hypothetical protein